MNQLGKALIGMGLLIAAIGVVLVLAGKLNIPVRKAAGRHHIPEKEPDGLRPVRDDARRQPRAFDNLQYLLTRYLRV
ncbi:hypothetical protein [uncultured Cloacibacillus sp.]|uniref:hypothetical protein n=1 Tax=uncultured Cloacibacillus sp. TaxID=889794 RepID=UPI00320A3D91